MRIEAGGKRWIVQERELPDTEGGERFCDVAFRNEELDDDLVQIRWVVKPRRMTEDVAHALFELAGERLWRDPEDGMVHRIQLEAQGMGDPAEGEELPAPLAVFQSETGRYETPYDLDVPLGAAPDEALASLLRRARGGRGTGPTTESG